MNIEKLISEVQARSVLWDHTKNEYRNVLKRNKAWDEVAASLKSDEKMVRNKWKYLRDMYSRHLKTERSGAAGGIQKNWVYAASMSFLRDVVTPRATTSNWDDGGSSTVEYNDIEYLEEPPFDISSQFETLSNVSTPPHLNTSHLNTSRQESQEHQANNLIRPNKKRHMSNDATHKEFQVAIIDTLNQMKSTHEKPDYLELFLLSQYGAIKKMKVENQEKTKLEIQTIVYKNTIIDNNEHCEEV